MQCLTSTHYMIVCVWDNQGRMVSKIDMLKISRLGRRQVCGRQRCSSGLLLRVLHSVLAVIGVRAWIKEAGQGYAESGRQSVLGAKVQ